MIATHRTIIIVVAALAGALLGACGDRAAAPTSASAPSREAIAAALASAEKLLAAQRFEEAEIVAAQLATKDASDWRAHELLGRVLSARAAVFAERAGGAEGTGGADGAGGAEGTGRAESAEHAAPDSAAQRIVAYRARANDAYGRAAALAAGNASLWSAAGVAAELVGDLDAARDRFAKAAELAPDDPRPPLFEAQVHLRRQQLDDAARCLDRALVLRPDEPYALASRAEIARQRGDFEDALRDVRAARRAAGEDVAFRVAEARILRQSGHARDGLELLLALGEPRWRERDVVEEVALGFAAIGEPARAAQAWEAAHRARPKDWTLALRCADMWLLADDPVRADVWLGEAEVAAPADPRVVDLRGRIGERIRSRQGGSPAPSGH
ncbi:MAG: tetratricopeptide repeat protein [Phycisphaerales bacterium]